MSPPENAFEATLRTLTDWIEVSSGAPIQVRDGEELAFRSDGAASGEALRTAAAVDGHYSKLMEAVGSCLLFYGGAEGRGGVEIYSANEVPELYSDFFGNESMDGFYPIGANLDTLEIYAYDTTRIEPNFSPFWHDSNPEDWRDTADELGSWTTLPDYLGQLVSNLGMIVV